MSTDNAKDLMQTFQKTGAKEAGHRLFAMYRKPLWRFLLLLSKSETNADDLSQRVWLKIIEIAERGSYRPQKNATFRTYLFTIARNMFIDDTRVLWANAEHTSDSELEQLTDSTVIPMDSMVATEHSKRELHVAMLQLPVAQREVLVMWADGFGFDEIAAIVDAPRNTVIGRKRYGIEKLQAILKELNVESPSDEVSQ